jgi:hypothetical protein
MILELSKSKFGLGEPTTKEQLKLILIIAIIIAKYFAIDYSSADSEEEEVDLKEASTLKMATYYLL